MTNNDLITLLCAHVGWPTPLSEPAAKKSVDYLVHNDFVEYDTTFAQALDRAQALTTTEKAHAFIRALHTVPMPVRTWAVPKSTESHHAE